MLAKAEIELYTIQQQSMRFYHPTELHIMVEQINEISNKKIKSFMVAKQAKLKRLLEEQKPSNSLTKPTFIPNYIVNISSIQLNEKETNLLNKGLNFALPHRVFPMKQSIVDVESAVAFSNRDTTNHIRACSKLILNSEKKKKRKINKATTDMYEAFGSLNKKDVYITKADKGNSVVIINKADYDASMYELLKNGPYKVVRNPYNKMKTAITDVIADYKELKTQICPNIQFTCEVENNKCLPFLDLLLIRNEEDEIEINIHRKPTRTQRFISSDSHHHPAHMYAAFESMVHRMCVLPLNKTSYEAELQYISTRLIKMVFDVCRLGK